MSQDPADKAAAETESADVENGDRMNADLVPTVLSPEDDDDDDDCDYGGAPYGDGNEDDDKDGSTPKDSAGKPPSRRKFMKQYRRGSMLRRRDDRRDHFRKLFVKRKIHAAMAKSLARVTRSPSEMAMESESEMNNVRESYSGRDIQLFEELRKEVEDEIDMAEVGGGLGEAQAIVREFYKYSKYGPKDLSLEVRLQNLTYAVPVSAEEGKVQTVYNSSFVYNIVKFFQRVAKGEKKKSSIIGTQNVLEDINLILKPGRMYLLLGPPASGKSTLLKAITGKLQPSKQDKLSGTINYNGRTLGKAKTRDHFHIENSFAYIDQLDKHAPRLTVAETFEFSRQCKGGGQYTLDDLKDTDVARAYAERAIAEGLQLQVVVKTLGLTDVQDTFVGDTTIRGVSGGQRRRVTVGEMLTYRTPVLCGDEISTGLDAASTFTMVQALLQFGKIQKASRLFALLQPSPETVSLFDEVVLLSEGRMIFAGPIEEVEDYFAQIGYKSPDFMDVADFLQMVSTEDGAELYDPPPTIKEVRPNPPSLAELAEIYKESTFAKSVRSELESPLEDAWGADDARYSKQVSDVAGLREAKRQFANSFPRSTLLVTKRFLTLWVRDKRVIIAGVAKNILMGVSVGGVYLNAEEIISLQGALFQTGLFIMLGAMQNASALVEDRVVFYKHKDANFYSAAPFALGRSLSQLPQTIIETVIFSTILFFMVGFGGREVVNYFVYLAILIVYAILMNQQLAVFASFASASSLQACSAIVLLLLILFGGYIMAPNVIPDYYSWIYWWNPFAWTYRALMVNEFRSDRWENPDAVLTTLGFVLPDDEPFGQEWVAYNFAYSIPYLVLCVVLTGLGLTFGRAGGAPAATPAKAADDNAAESNPIEIAFKPVNLSFSDICYTVTASTSKEQLKLLNNANGVFRSGRMCALMGSSGAGKTTLMDVIALRKSSGIISGVVRLNGFLQDPVAFRRCSGYVEQFDVQSPELTVRETVLFSARLRLDPTVVETDGEKEAFVDRVLADSELTELAHTLVGTDEGVGLSFEQKKRLSIAVELAASPSVLFLDEPTSGLDSRSALLVVKTLRKIANAGRTVCATIHQPSSAVFAMFDELLLLKKGGNVVFNGDLGEGCSNLLTYFEERGAPRIELGENPANWMLHAMTSESMGDLAKAYVDSDGYTALKQELDAMEQSADPDQKIEYESAFAAPRGMRQSLINERLRIIYWRSPAYNLARLLVSLVISFVLGSVFITKRNQQVFTENDMRARLSVVFLTFIIMGILAIFSVLPVMTKIRDMFYRHRAAGMYDSASIGLALGVAEKWFILLTCVLFTLVFLSVSGMTSDAGDLIQFFGFFTFNFAIYSYFGQAFVCLVKAAPTAIILSSVFIGINNFFSGLIVRPQLMVGGFYALPYYICPGHYVYEGLVTSLFSGDTRTVEAEPGTEFYAYLVANDSDCTGTDQPECDGTVDQFIDSFFGGEFQSDHNVRNAILLGVILIITRVLTFMCLKYIRFS